MVWGDGGWNYVSGVSGYRMGPDEDNTSWMNTVTPGFFDAMGIPFVAGRDFAEQDRPAKAGSWRVAIVNEKLARHYFGSKSPVGEQISFFNIQGAKVTIAPVEIIGVIKDTKNKNLREPQADVTYLPLPADQWSAVVARAKPGVSPTTVEAEIRAAFATVSKDIEVDAGPIEDAIQRSLGRDRLVARLSAVFGALGIFLASMGLYAAIAHSVSSRTREIGIRIAVGASARRVSWMVLKQSLGVTVAGLLVGFPLAIAGSQAISSLLFGVSPFDPATLTVSATVLALTGLLAGWWPARRAARLDPSKTLRFE
jgi:ABC-type antimicrobial peptide transport system permease subunit